MSEKNYLNVSYTLKSWLLTVDHKRIGLMYLLSVTGFFMLGGLFAMLIRLELMTPVGDLLQAENYNKVFTMHGLVMIFFFLSRPFLGCLGISCSPLWWAPKTLRFRV